MRATVIINPVAGSGRARTIGASVELARTILTLHHYDTEVRITEGPDDAHRFARAAVEDGAALVVAWGGDGTVNGAAAAVSGTATTLAIVPGGSGNGLARDLGIPLNAAEALRVAATGSVRAIDAGDLDGSLFFNVAGIGLDANIAGRLATKGHRRGLPGYVLATVAELRSYSPCAYSITEALDADGRRVEDITHRRAMFIALANSRQYGSGARIAPRALLDDGSIEVVVVEPLSALGILRQLPPLFRGTLTEGRGIIMRSAASLALSCDAPIPYHVDGEPRRGGPTLRLITRRQVLRVKAG
jgi:YegS/Rv2252/BmrU family lipid kinase